MTSVDVVSTIDRHFAVEKQEECSANAAGNGDVRPHPSKDIERPRHLLGGMCS